MMGYSYLAEGIEDVVKVDKDLTLGYFGDVIHGLAGIVPYASILVGETSQNRRDDNLEVSRELLVETNNEAGRYKSEQGAPA